MICGIGEVGSVLTGGWAGPCFADVVFSREQSSETDTRLSIAVVHGVTPQVLLQLLPGGDQRAARVLRLLPRLRPLPRVFRLRRRDRHPQEPPQVFLLQQRQLLHLPQVPQRRATQRQEGQFTG